MFKFIHAADIHLDSPLRGLEQYEGAPVDIIRDAARRALENLVSLAIREEVRFVLIAGDLYDGDWRDYNTGLFFVRQATRLQEAGIRLYFIAGNHDAANKMTRSLRLPENVTYLSAAHPETARIPELDVAIHGQSFSTAAVYDDLSANYPVADGGLINIGMLHTCATGRDGHDRYAPCTIDGLRLKNYDYWALGHVHKREILSQEPFIAFPGNIQGRHIREVGAKGCLLVTVGDDRQISSEFHELDVLRWAHADVNLQDDEQSVTDVDDVLDHVAAALREQYRIADGRTLAVRVHLNGATPAHRRLTAAQTHLVNEIRSLALEAGQGEIWVEKVALQTTAERAVSRPAADVSDNAVSELTNLFREAHDNPALLTELGFKLDDLTKKLPDELKHFVEINDPQQMRSLLEQAESWLLSELLSTETSS